MFQYEFMRYAFLASTFIAITCGVVGVYVVARSYAFLAHTLSEIGFAAPGLSDTDLSGPDFSGPDFSAPDFSWQGLSPQVLPCPAGASAVAPWAGAAAVPLPFLPLGLPSVLAASMRASG